MNSPNASVFWNRINELQREVHSILANKLSYPKTILSLPEKSLSEDKGLKARHYIDQAIVLVDTKFDELLDEFES